MRQPDAWSDMPRLRLRTPEDPLARALRAASEFFLKHPLAAQALFTALVAEGRRFAQTPEGRRWRAGLAQSELVRRGRALWEGSLLNMLDDDPDAVMPSSVFDALVRTTSVALQPVAQPRLRVETRDAEGR